CRGWLVNNAQNVKACNLAGFLGCLALCVLEVCRNSNNCIRNVFTEVSLCVALELRLGASGDFLRGVLLVIALYAPVGADVARNGADGAVNVGNSLVLCRLTNKDFAVLRESYNRWGGTCTL